MLVQFIAYQQSENIINCINMNKFSNVNWNVQSIKPLPLWSKRMNKSLKREKKMERKTLSPIVTHIYLPIQMWTFCVTVYYGEYQWSTIESFITEFHPIFHFKNYNCLFRVNYFILLFKDLTICLGRKKKNHRAINESKMLEHKFFF